MVSTDHKDATEHMGTLIKRFKDAFVCVFFRFKDDVLIRKNTTNNYKMSGLSLSITDVQQKHTGVYKISMGIPGKGLYRNLSYTLVVTCKLLP